MFLGYIFELRPNSLALGSTGSVIYDIGLSINDSPEGRAAATSKGLTRFRQRLACKRTLCSQGIQGTTLKLND